MATIKVASENRVQIPVRALLGVADGQGGLDLGGQVRAEVAGQDRGGGPGRIGGGVGHGVPPG